MKKLITLLIVAFAFLLAACGRSGEHPQAEQALVAPPTPAPIETPTPSQTPTPQQMPTPVLPSRVEIEIAFDEDYEGETVLSAVLIGNRDIVPGEYIVRSEDVRLLDFNLNIIDVAMLFIMNYEGETLSSHVLMPGGTTISVEAGNILIMSTNIRGRTTTVTFEPVESTPTSTAITPEVYINPTRCDGFWEFFTTLIELGHYVEWEVDTLISVSSGARYGYIIEHESGLSIYFYVYDENSAILANIIDTGHLYTLAVMGWGAGTQRMAVALETYVVSFYPLDMPDFEGIMDFFSDIGRALARALSR